MTTLDNDEDDEEDDLTPITVIHSVDDVDNDYTPFNDEIQDTTITPETTDDHNEEEYDLNMSASRPRWIDRDRGSENVTSAELPDRVLAWLHLQHQNFFPFLV